MFRRGTFAVCIFGCGLIIGCGPSSAAEMNSPKMSCEDIKQMLNRAVNQSMDADYGTGYNERLAATTSYIQNQLGKPTKMGQEGAETVMTYSGVTTIHIASNAAAGISINNTCP